MIKKLIIISFLALIFYPVWKSSVLPGKMEELIIYSANGVILRKITSFEGETTEFVRLKQLPSYVPFAFIAAEDKRFLSHHGIDIIATVRALITDIKAGKVVSGGSTITQQLARLCLRSRSRNIFRKFLEAAYSLKMELFLSKATILEAYLNRIYFGNRAYGISSASELYFGKKPSELSPTQASFLAVIVRNPSYFNPYIRREEIKRRSVNILREIRGMGIISRKEFRLALKENIRISPEQKNFKASHFVDFILKEYPQLKGASRVWTTLNFALQRKVEALLKGELQRLKGKRISNMAAVVLSNDGEILAMVGSRGYFYPEFGQFNAAVSFRQPGSALKPFTYALALEMGIPTSLVLEDESFSEINPYGKFFPRNYDKIFHGKVPLREALACSYNIAAVKLTSIVGVENLKILLSRLGMEFKKSTSYYGLGLTLGDGEVTLLSLTNSYRVFPNKGYFSNYSAVKRIMKDGRIEEFSAKKERIFPPEVSYIITDILKDNQARSPSFGDSSPLEFPFNVGVKTGTSSMHRDNWTIGFTTRNTVGVWAGNNDGSPMLGTGGVDGAAPLFRDIILTLAEGRIPPAFKVPDGIVKIKICEGDGQPYYKSCPTSRYELFYRGNLIKKFLNTLMHKE